MASDKELHRYGYLFDYNSESLREVDSLPIAETGCVLLGKGKVEME
jgi:hypothetical protein